MTTGMKGGAAWEKDRRGREPAVSSISSGQPGLQVSAGAAVPSQARAPDQASQPQPDRLRGGSGSGSGSGPSEPSHSGRQSLMGPPQRLDRPRTAPDRALDAHVGMPALDWLGEPNGHARPEHSSMAEATRQASGALIETMGHPNNASFLLSFMDGGSSGGSSGKDGESKEQPPGSFRVPAPNGRSQAAMPPASSLPGNARPLSSGR